MVQTRNRIDEHRQTRDRKHTTGSVKKRYSSTQVACNLCRSRKSACNGRRPACSLCAAREIPCVYDTRDPAETRTQALRRQNEELRMKIQELEDTGLSFLTGGHGGVSESFGETLLVADPQNSASGRSSRQRTEPSENVHDNEIASTLLQAMYEGDDIRSTFLLARLRTGERPEDIVRLHAHHCPENEVTSTRLQASLQDAPALESDSADDSVLHIPSYFDRNVWANSDRLTRPWTANSEDQRRETLVIAPCLDNRFGNLSFRDAILANHQSVSVQSMQQQNLALPYWATRTLNDGFDCFDPYEAVIAELNGEIHRGHDITAICGSHAYVDALNDPQVFARAPRLSQLTAMLIQGVKCGEALNTVTPYALMWLHWSLLRWMLMPTTESFFAVPGLMRPLPSQLFTLHSRVLDFVFPVSLREYVVQQATNDLRWITEGCKTITCEWPFTLDEAFSLNAATGEKELSAACKTYVNNAETWSLGPSVRSYLSNVDRYARIA